MVKKTTNCGVHVKLVIKGGEDKFFSVVKHICELEYLGMSKKISLCYIVNGLIQE